MIGTAAIAGHPVPGRLLTARTRSWLHALVRERLPLFAIGLVTAALTAFYMSRLLFMTFFGEFRGDHEAEHHVHESPWSMLFPLCVLAMGCFVVGQIHIPEFVHEAVRSPDEKRLLEPEWLPLRRDGTALAGILGAFYLYVVYTGAPARIAAALRPRAPRARSEVGLRPGLRCVRAPGGGGRHPRACCGRSSTSALIDGCGERLRQAGERARAGESQLADAATCAPMRW